MPGATQLEVCFRFEAWRIQVKGNDTSHYQ